jgi:small subunit ribosomal protein S6
MRKNGRRENTRMRYYETLYIINPDMSDEEYRAVVAKINNVVEKESGVITRVEEWGKRTLAYEVKKFDKGSYVLLQYCGEAGIVETLKREMSLDERVIKFQTIKLSDHADPEALKAAEDADNQAPAEEKRSAATDTPTGDDENGV